MSADFTRQVGDYIISRNGNILFVTEGAHTVCLNPKAMFSLEVVEQAHNLWSVVINGQPRWLPFYFHTKELACEMKEILGGFW